MTKPYLNRSDIILEEEVEEEVTISSTNSTTYWYARMDGELEPTKERVIMDRQSKSAGEALLLLKEAIEEQGWELHD